MNCDLTSRTGLSLLGVSEFSVNTFVYDELLCKEESDDKCPVLEELSLQNSVCKESCQIVYLKKYLYLMEMLVAKFHYR